MSSVGWQVVAHIGAGEDAIERLGGLLPWELARIRREDWTPIVRRLEPAFSEGQRIVISTSYHRPQLVRDDERQPTGEVIPALRLPTVTITMHAPRRTARGLWSVPFDVHDSRDPARRIRRVPPVRAVDDEVSDGTVTEAEEREARLESSYGGSPRYAVDDQEAVRDGDLNRFTAEARAMDILAKRASDHRAAEERRRFTSLEQDLADALKEAEQKGIDTTSVRFITERQIARLRNRLQRVA